MLAEGGARRTDGDAQDGEDDLPSVAGAEHHVREEHGGQRRGALDDLIDGQPKPDLRTSGGAMGECSCSADRGCRQESNVYACDNISGRGRRRGVDCEAMEATSEVPRERVVRERVGRAHEREVVQDDR